MEQVNVRKLFDAGMKLKTGKKALIGFPTKKAAETARVQLYQEKGRYNKKVKEKTEELTFTRVYKEEDGQYFIQMEKQPTGFILMIEDENGNFKMADLETEVESIAENVCLTEEDEKASIAKELKRFITLKRENEDWDDEKIEEYFKESNSDLAGFKWKEILGEE